MYKESIQFAYNLKSVKLNQKDDKLTLSVVVFRKTQVKKPRF